MCLLVPYPGFYLVRLSDSPFHVCLRSALYLPQDGYEGAVLVCLLDPGDPDMPRTQEITMSRCAILGGDLDGQGILRGGGDVLKTGGLRGREDPGRRLGGWGGVVGGFRF